MLWRPLVAALLLLSLPARAQEEPPLSRATAVQTAAEALTEDASDYAGQYGVPQAEALRRLEAQEASVPETDRLAALYADRLAGITVEHRPDFRIVVHLTGSDPVADIALLVGGTGVAVHFEVGAAATRTAILAAITAHQADVRALFAHPPGMGVDPHTGKLLVTVAAADVPEEDAADTLALVSSITGVPTELRAFADVSRDLAVEGGGRVVGLNPGDPRTYLCTTGFVVTDGTETGVTTAAHCPDQLSWVPPGGGDRVPLTMIGAWGASTQDVQIHVGGGEPMPPLFFARQDKQVARPLDTWRLRESTRVGDFVCHRGERSGTSCAEVAFADYAPPGDLCAGPCPPTWVAVEGPHCHGGDSGGPVFLGTTAFGTLKGGSYTGDGTCRIYYYMSTDYLPAGWRLLTEPPPATVLPATAPPPSDTLPPTQAPEAR